MAGGMRKVGLYLGLVEDDGRRNDGDARYDDYDQAYDGAGYDEGYAEPAYAERSPVRRFDADRGAPVTRGAARGETRGSLALEDTRPVPTVREEPAADYRITTMHPRTYNEAKPLGEHYRDGIPVIMNLTEMDELDARRLVDFAAGLTFGLNGSLERVTSRVFLLSPANVTVTPEDKQRIAEGGFFNQS